MELTNRMIAERLGNPAGYDNYLRNTDAALKLPLPDGLFFVLMVNQHGATCSISPRLGVVEGDVEAASTPAEAVCKAWYGYAITTNAGSM